jgi:hypothetical protein
MEASPTPLKTTIEQLLTEARLIIPGGQALFGFQFIAMLTSGFDRLQDASSSANRLSARATNPISASPPPPVVARDCSLIYNNFGRRVRAQAFSSASAAR